MESSFYWFLLFLFLFLSLLFYSLRPLVPFAVSLYGANFFILGSISFMLFSSIYVSGRKIQKKWQLVLPLAAFLVFIALHSNHFLSSLFYSVYFLSVCSIATFFVLKPLNPADKIILRNIFIVYCFLVLLHVYRIIAILLYDQYRNSLFPGNGWESLYIIVLISLMTALCLSYVSTVNLIRSEELERHINKNGTLLKELRHRTKNNLALINSLVSLQSQSVQDPEAREAFSNLSKRLGTISSVYNLLSRDDDQVMGSKEITSYLESVVEGIEDTLPYNYGIRISLEVSESLHIDISRLVPLGLIVNELSVNAVKYAYPDTKSGPVRISLFAQNNAITLKVEDDGVGYNKKAAGNAASGHGLTLVEALTEQLRGRFTISAPEAGGTRCQLSFPHSK